MAVVLVLGMVLIGAIAIIGVGSVAIGGTENQLSDQRAEKTLTQLDSKAGLVALGQAGTQQISLPTDAGEQYSVQEAAGRMRVEVTNLSNETDSFEVMNETLGAVVYDLEDARIAYQGGGVWRATEQGGSMISPPEFHYRDGTLTLPAVSVVGDSSLGSTTRIEQESGDRKFPIPGQVDRLNPLDNHRVDVTVDSEYYMGWGQYFIERTDGSVEYDHANESVTVTLVTPVDINEITAASASLSAGGEFNVSGTSASTCGKSGADDVFTSSFDSSMGSYCDQFAGGTPPGDDGDVVYGKDVDISDGTGGSIFYGDITSGQTVTIDDSSGSGQPSVYGNISYADDCLPSGDCDDRIASGSGGTVREIDGIKLTESIDWFVETTLEAIEDDPDDTFGDVDDVSGSELDAGTYYFDTFDLGDNEQLDLNTTDGPVVLAVGGNVTLRDSSELSVLGDEHVELYVGGNGTGGNLVMENEAAVTAPNDNGTKFRTYGKADFDARLGGGGSGNLAVYTGVIYAPPGSGGTGSIVLDGAEIFGGILTGQTTLRGGSIHYDEALEGRKVVPEDAYIIRVTYLHVSHATIRMSG